MLLADRILFIDAEAMILDKPAGLPVDPPRDGSLSVESHLDSLRFGFVRRPAAAHRLDRDTSGCLLLARNPKALKRFGAAFEAGTVEKLYRAVIDGVPDAENGTIDLSLAKVSTRERGWRMIPARAGQRAVTHWRRIAVEGGRALIEFRPETGRTHQLRVHAVEGLGAAIVGDPVYGDGQGTPSTGSGQEMLLHAISLSMPRGSKPPAAAVAPLPPHFPDWARG